MKNKRPESRREKMPVSQRAKQFMPFSAVTGLEKALKEKEIQIEKAAEANGRINE